VKEKARNLPKRRAVAVLIGGGGGGGGGGDFRAYTTASQAAAESSRPVPPPPPPPPSPRTPMHRAASLCYSRMSIVPYYKYVRSTTVLYSTVYLTVLSRRLVGLFGLFTACVPSSSLLEEPPLRLASLFEAAALGEEPRWVRGKKLLVLARLPSLMQCYF